jgi:deoxyribodipyrimidine photo-lyase
MTQIDERTTLLNDRAENNEARYVLYFMQIFKRTSHNFAFNFAIEAANERKLPLVVYEGLKYYYPWASDRLHTYILEGVEEKRSAFAKQGIRYVFYLQRNERDPRDTVARLANDAALVVTDDFPCFIIPHHNARVAARATVPVYAVDSNGIIPLSKFTKEEFAARTIRPKINRVLPEYLEPLTTPELHTRAPELEVNCPEETRDTSLENIPGLVASCAIDHSVTPSPRYHGGTKNARARLTYFLEKVLPRYDELRNDPSIDGTSRLSSYLHFGFLSAHEIVEAVNKSETPQAGKDAFLEELIVRRELGYNMTRFNPAHTSLDSLPDWAKKTMNEHAADPRPALLSREQIESAQTYDALWDATQRELLRTGEIHNYARMLWGKLVIQWCATYEEAFALLEYMNNKYALDGRNPNSYAGILWCFGKHDRAWGPVRPVFGKLRYMTSQSMARKFNARKYIEWTHEFPALAVESTTLDKPPDSASGEVEQGI